MSHNNSFKPTPHRGINSVLYATLHAVAAPLRGGLTQALGATRAPMITPVTKQEAEALWERLSSPMERVELFPESDAYPMERVELFPESDAYGTWIEKIGQFVSSKGGSSAIGVEEYRADFEFFTASCEEQLAILFLTKLAQLELVFFGPDWVIRVSSYPQHEGSRFLERSVRLYGAATMAITSQ